MDFFCSSASSIEPSRNHQLARRTHPRGPRFLVAIRRTTFISPTAHTAPTWRTRISRKRRAPAHVASRCFAGDSTAASVLHFPPLSAGATVVHSPNIIRLRTMLTSPTALHFISADQLKTVFDSSPLAVAIVGSFAGLRILSLRPRISLPAGFAPEQAAGWKRDGPSHGSRRARSPRE